jgi:hypothetical protein
LVLALVGQAVANLRLRRFDQARPLLDEAEACEVGGFAVLLLMRTRGLLATYVDDRAEAARIFRDVAEISRTRGEVQGQLSALGNVAEAEFARGNVDAAIEAAEATAPLFVAGGAATAAVTLSNLAGYRLARDDVAGAREAAFAALALPVRSQQHFFTLEHLALAFALGGDGATAATLAAYAMREQRVRDIVGDYTERATHERLDALLARMLTPAAREAAEALAAHFDLDAIVDFARGRVAGSSSAPQP